MFGYILFIVRCLVGKFKFFNLSPPKKALFLKNCGLYFEAGRYYYKIEAYDKAIKCFEKCQAHRNLMVCYEKLGLISEAVSIAHTHRLYKEGANICMRYNQLKKAAYFYHFFDMPKAIKIYKKLGSFHDLGLCYLCLHRHQAALDAFMQCENPLDKLEGMRLIEEAAIVCYFRKQYKQAIKLFADLNDYHSVLECAKRLKDDSLIKHTTMILTAQAFESGNLQEASRLAASFDHHLSRLYTYLDKLQDDSLLLAFHHKDYFTLLKYCFDTNNLLFAKAIHHYWLHESPPNVLLSA